MTIAVLLFAATAIIGGWMAIHFDKPGEGWYRGYGHAHAVIGIIGLVVCLAIALGRLVLP